MVDCSSPGQARVSRPLAMVLVCVGFGAVLLGARVPIGQRGVATPTAGSALVIGRVVAADGTTPVAAATVAISAGTPRDAQRVLTDSQGRFFFNQLPAGSYRLTASKPGYLDGAYGRRRPGGTPLPLDVADAATPPPAIIELWHTAVVTGRVIDDRGDPMVDVTVRVVQKSFGAGHAQWASVTKVFTDDRGVYRFSTLTPGDYVVAVPATVTSAPASFAGASRAAGQTPPQYLQTMTTIGAAPMSFDDVQNVTATPKTLVSSILSLPSTPPAEGAWLTYPTTYLPATEAIGTAMVVHALPGENRPLPDLVLRLTKTYEVSGAVSGPDGPAPFFAVHLLPADAIDYPLFDVATATTDASGAFTFYGVPPGPYVARVVRAPTPGGASRLAVVSGGGRTDRSVGVLVGGGRGAQQPPPVPTDPLLYADRSVTVADRSVGEIDLALRAGPRVTGRAVFNGSAPVPRPDQWALWGVSLEPAGGQFSGYTQPSRVDQENRFVTPGQWPGRYLVRATAPPGWTFAGATVDGHDVSEVPLDLTTDVDDVVVTFTDRTTKITGSVLGSESESVVGAAVLLFPVDPAGWVDYGRTSRRVRSVTATSTGAFSMPRRPRVPTISRRFQTMSRPHGRIRHFWRRSRPSPTASTCATVSRCRTSFT